MKILIVGIEGSSGWMKSDNDNTFAFVDAFGELEKSGDETKNWINKNCDVYENIYEANNLFNPDFVSVCVPNFVKNDPKIELFFIGEQIPLMISKLRLSDKKDFYALLNSADANDSEVYIGEFYRYIPCVETVKKIIESGEIGVPEQIRYECGLPESTIWEWEKNYKHLSAEDLAFHHFSVLHYLVDITPKSVFGESFTPIKGGGIGGTVSSALIVTKKGCHISHNIDWHNTIRKTDHLGYIYIDGTEGGVSIEHGRVYTMKWGSTKTEIPVIEVNETSAPEKVLSGKLNEIWTVQDFKPIIDCIYSIIGEA